MHQTTEGDDGWIDKNQECLEVENDLETLEAICETIREKHGSDKFLSQQIERKKATFYVNGQINAHLKIQKNQIRRLKTAEKFTKFTPKDCGATIKLKASSEESEPFVQNEGDWCIEKFLKT